MPGDLRRRGRRRSRASARDGALSWPETCPPRRRAATGTAPGASGATRPPPAPSSPATSPGVRACGARGGAGRRSTRREPRPDRLAPRRREASGATSSWGRRLRHREAGCAVASDFRQRDVAAGGEALSALADGLVRPGAAAGAILNLGGMANPPSSARARTSPRVRHGAGRSPSMDSRGGSSVRSTPTARRRPERRIRRSSPHFSSTFLRPPPKHRPRHLRRRVRGTRPVKATARARGGVLASAVQLVAGVPLLRAFRPGPRRVLLVAGGGVRTRAHARARLGAPARLLVRRGRRRPGSSRALSSPCSARCALGIPSTHPGATGARRGRVLGKLSHA